MGSEATWAARAGVVETKEVQGQMEGGEGRREVDGGERVGEVAVEAAAGRQGTRIQRNPKSRCPKASCSRCHSLAKHCRSTGSH